MNLSMEHAREITLTRTLLPFFLPMRKPEDALSALAMMSGSQPGHLKFRLGILTSRFRSNHPLKACTQCMQKDLAMYGVAYWHLSHQFPGVWICDEHAKLLVQATTKSTGVGRFQWTLPNSDDLTSVIADDGRLAALIDIPGLLRFSRLAKTLGTLPAGTHFDASQLANTYRHALLERGLLTPSGKLRLSQLSADYAGKLSSLQIIPEFRGFAVNTVETRSDLGRWLRTPRGGTHPLRHLSIIYWLFPDWDTFIDHYSHRKNSHCQEKNSQNTSEVPSCDPRRIQALSLIEQGVSYSQIAKSTGIDVQTAITWGAKAGYKTSRRPKTLKANVLQELITALKTGLDKTVAAEKFSISVATVTRILRSEVGLQNTWHEVRFNLARERAKSSWVAAAAAFPDLGLKALRNIAPAAYAWLYRNDRTWLSENSSQLRLPSRIPAKERVDWHSRDLILSAAVINTSEKIKTTERCKKVPLWRIYQLLPELKAKLSALKRLPLTTAAIRNATGCRYPDLYLNDIF